MTPLYIYPNKTKVRVLFAFGLIFIPCAYFLWSYGVYTFSIILWIGGIVTTLFNFPKAFLKKPMLVLDENGITDHMNVPSSGFVPWSAMQRATFSEVMGFQNIIIILKDPESFIKSRSFLIRPFLRSNQKNLDSCVLFRTDVLPDNPNKILDLINKMIEINQKY
jgi:hypothetical protein